MIRKVYVLSVHPSPEFSKTRMTGCRRAVFSAPPTARRAIAVFRAIRRQLDAYRKKRLADLRIARPTSDDKRFDAAVEKILRSEAIPVITSGEVVVSSRYFEKGHMSMEVLEVWEA